MPNLDMSFHDFVEEWHNNQPHPQEPSLKVGEFPIAMKMAAVMKFGNGHPTPKEASEFYKQFQQVNQQLQMQKKFPFDPEEFIHFAKQVAQTSFAYHGRPPTLQELMKLKDTHPKEIDSYFGSLPDKHYPHVSAANMVKSMQSARPWANMNLERDPNKLEAAYLHHSGDNPKNYYEALKNQKDQMVNKESTSS